MPFTFSLFPLLQVSGFVFFSTEDIPETPFLFGTSPAPASGEAVFSFCRAACFRAVKTMAGMLSCTMPPMSCSSLKVCTALDKRSSLFQRRRHNESIWLFCNGVWTYSFRSCRLSQTPWRLRLYSPRSSSSCDGNLGMGGKVQQVDVDSFSQTVYRHQLFLLLT